MYLLRLLLVLTFAAGISASAVDASTPSAPAPSYAFAEIYRLAAEAKKSVLAAIAPEPQAAATYAGGKGARAESGAKRPGAADGVLVPVDAVPEPGGWMTLFSGILAMLFIAWRKTRLDPD